MNEYSGISYIYNYIIIFVIKYYISSTYTRKTKYNTILCKGWKQRCVVHVDVGVLFRNVIFVRTNFY